MIFKDRFHAGQLLAPYLKKYQNDHNAVVLGLPRGGVVTAYALAKSLNIPLDVICLRKIGAPNNPELAIGAVSASGVTYFNDSLISLLDVSEKYIESLVNREKQIAQQRLELYRKSIPEISVEGKTVIIVDDGLATGATMRAAIKSVQAAGANYIIVAIPVSPPDTLDEIQQEVDEAVCLEIPPYFSAVGQFYQEFSQVEDDEVLQLLKNSLKK